MVSIIMNEYNPILYVIFCQKFTSISKRYLCDCFQLGAEWCLGAAERVAEDEIRKMSRYDRQRSEVYIEGWKAYKVMSEDEIRRVKRMQYDEIKEIFDRCVEFGICDDVAYYKEVK